MGSLFEAIDQFVSGIFNGVGAAFIRFCEIVFQPVLSKFFGPINGLLAPIYQPYATIIAIAFFVGTMLWVAFGLKESYVNLGAPKKAWYTDLRIWTVCSMLPHVFVYFYFY